MLPVIFSKVEEGRDYLKNLLNKEIKRGFGASFMYRTMGSIVVMKEGAGVWEREYILEKLSFPRTIYAEAEPITNYCGRVAGR